jgi:hypothetical protein
MHGPDVPLQVKFECLVIIVRLSGNGDPQPKKVTANTRRQFDTFKTEGLRSIDRERPACKIASGHHHRVGHVSPLLAPCATRLCQV